jgi:hypothetical protein
MMSETQTIMKFEFLPNEILIECFAYLNVFDIFHSFDQLNNRFNKLIRRISLCINLKKDINKSIFDEFRTKMLLDPQIKDQIYSLHLPSCVENNPASLRTKTFLSSFSYKQFCNLQQLKSMIIATLTPMSTESSHLNSDYVLEVSDTLFPKLRILSISRLHKPERIFENITSSITHLTLDECDLNDFYYLSKHAPMLKYLCINRIQYKKYPFNKDTKESFNGQGYLHLKQLILNDFQDSFDDFEMFVKLTPNLKSLTISPWHDDMIDANRWERLITSSLPYLDIFKFDFICSRSKNIYSSIVGSNQFQTDFWQKQHHWFTEYAITNRNIYIYTIPCILTNGILYPNCKRYSNHLQNNINTFVNMTHLKLYSDTLTKDCEYYFSNVISLKLISENNEFLTIERIKYLEKIVNLFNLKHLDISELDNINNSLLLKIIEQVPQLFSLSLKRNQFISIFNERELCKYLNKMIKRLYINENNYRFIDNSYEGKRFYKVFSNIEHLQFENSHERDLLFLLNHLPKLSTLQVKWNTADNPKNYLSQFVNEIQKQNVIYDINIGGIQWHPDDSHEVLESAGRSYDIDIVMWCGNNIS